MKLLADKNFVKYFSLKIILSEINLVYARTKLINFELFSAI